MANAEVRMYLDHVRLVVEQATEAALAAIAFQMEAEVKVQIRNNGQVDTGFMLNSVYATTKRDGDSYDAAEAEARAAADRAGEPRAMAPRRTLPGDAAAGVIVGAEYAVYQEAAQSFLYAGAQRVAGYTAGVTAEAVYREQVGD